MKAVILAGGLGTRLIEETSLVPKPMIEIGGKPILWHIMKIYSAHNVQDFVICCGYKGYIIKEYFSNYALHMSNVTFNMADNSMEIHQSSAEPWTVTLVDTGESSMTGGRLKRVRRFLDHDKPFCFTYGDGVADVDVTKLLASHERSGRLVSLTATRPPGRFGALRIGNNDQVTEFEEKPRGDRGWINGGFFVAHPSALDYVSGDQTSWEAEPLTRLAAEGQLGAFKHEGFWQPMDTLRDRNQLNDLWASGKAPWKIW
jgi:glucose-1-phosphate cytidylyltransferase